MNRKASKRPAPQKEGLTIRAGNDAPLSRTQVEFSRLMKSLEATKARHTREQARPDEPQYGPLQRFRNPYYGTIANPASIKRDLRGELTRHREMLEVLAANNAASRRMIYDWADENARRSSCPF